MPSAPPLVTIGLPVYNGETFVARTIQSLLAQTLGDFEILVSDNASTDGTVPLVRRFAESDPRIRLFEQPSNRGVARNWNFVARQARGRYFKWSSASDLYAPNFLATCVDALEQAPDAALAFTWTTYIDDGDREIGRSDRDFDLTDEDPVGRFVQICVRLSINNALQGVFRTDLVNRTRLVRNYPAGDLVFMSEAALRGKFVLVPQRLTLRRASPEHWTANREPGATERMFWPSGSPRLRIIHIRRHVDYIAAALGAPLPARDRLRALIFTLKHAYWSRAALGADLRQAFLGRGAHPG